MEKKKRLGRQLGFLSTVLASSLAVGTIVSSCSGVAWKSTVQLQVADVGSILADQSFSESAYNGLREFYMKDCGIEYVPEANSSDLSEGNGLWKRPGEGNAARIASYENIKNDGSNIVLATAFTHETALQMLTSDSFSADKEKLKDTGFIFVDGAMKTEWKDGETTYKSNPTNIASISYRADEGSFLTGLATAVYLNENHSLFANGTTDSTIGVSAYVGYAIEPTLSFFNGFRQGLMYWNTIADKIELDDGKAAFKMKWISPGNNYEISQFSSDSFAPNNEKASVLTTNMINNGAKAIMPIAGPQTKLSVNRVAQLQKPVSIIGVDTEQENISDLKKELPGDSTKNIIPFSSLKEISYSTHQVLKAIKTGQASNGYNGFGWNNIADLNNNGVGVSKAGYSYLIDPLFFAENPNGSDTGKISPTNTNADKTETYDLSSATTTTKWKLKDLKRGSDSTQYEKIYANFKKLLAGTTLIKTNGQASATNWKIVGDELTKTLDSTNFPVISGNAKYTIEGAFGGTESKQIATGSLLDGTKWTYRLERA